MTPLHLSGAPGNYKYTLPSEALEVVLIWIYGNGIVKYSPAAKRLGD
jgi:hypothetical protein